MPKLSAAARGAAGAGYVDARGLDDHAWTCVNGVTLEDVAEGRVCARGIGGLRGYLAHEDRVHPTSTSPTPKENSHAS